MSKIEIRTIADVKRAFAIPGILVFTDRNDVLAPSLVREPGRMTLWMAPRTVEKVRSADVILLQEGRQGYLTLPKASDFEADGTNVFTVVLRRKDDQSERRITYRLEMPGTPGANTPSRLPENHPPLAAEAVAKEESAAAAATAERQAEHAAYTEELSRVSSLPPPPADPRYDALMANMRAAIKDALAKGLHYNRDVEVHVRAHLAEPDFAVMNRLPDVIVQAGGRVPIAHLAGVKALHELGFEKRGTWRLIITRWPGQTTEATKVHVSAGAGGPAMDFGGSFAAEGEQAILHRMQDSEVYHQRKAVEAEQKNEKDAEALARRKFKIGQRLHDLVINGKCYSTATITEIDSERRSAKLTMKRRGSASTYSVTLSYSDLDRVAPQPSAEAAQAGQNALL